MKRLLLISIVVLALFGASAAHAEGGVTLLLQGGPADDTFSVELSADGRTYEIESSSALEVGAGLCWHPEGAVTRLTCEAPAISGFELNGGKGDDTLTIGRRVAIGSTLRGGSGNDSLSGGSGADKLLGFSGDDNLNGGSGNDAIFGAAGNDTIFGRQGDDRLNGGPGNDRIWGGTGNDELFGGPDKDFLNGGSGTNVIHQ